MDKRKVYEILRVFEKENVWLKSLNLDREKREIIIDMLEDCFEEGFHFGFDDGFSEGYNEGMENN